MEHFIEFGLFAGKVILIVGAIGVIIGLIASAALKANQPAHLEIENLNKTFEAYGNALKSESSGKKALKKLKKKQKKADKKKNEGDIRRKIYVLNFHGDIKASAVEYLADEVTAVLNVAEDGDEVVVRLESPGGMVHSYGLAAAQLLRIREGGLKLTICVDKIAASGGYMMACTGDRILGSPFAVFGSVGVLAQVPNFHKILKKNDVDYQEITAGEYKRTLSLFGEVTEQGKKKFTEQIEDTHVLFKEFVGRYRPQLDIAKIATGEHWYGLRAKELNLVDDIITSDAYLLSQKEDAQIYKIKMAHKKKVMERLSEAMGKAVQTGIEKAIEALGHSARF